MADPKKLLALAFNPSAFEGEAINAFLALRKEPNILDQLTGSYNNSSRSVYDDWCKSNTATPKKKVTRTWELKIPPNSFDAFYDVLVRQKSEPYFVLKHTTFRKKLLDRHEMELTVHMDSDYELDNFGDFITQIVEELKKP